MPGEIQPYVGPRPFERTEADQNRFFGRDDEASELMSYVIAHSELLLYSQSGAGKTSLINAKLTPMLERAGFEVLRPARVGAVLPEGSVVSEISNIYTFNVLRSWHDGSVTPERTARTTLAEFLEARHKLMAKDGEPKPRVAIFDQFEEVFTSYQERKNDREDFFDQVGSALEQDRLLRVVFAMREDYIAEMDPYLSLLPQRLRTRYRIERLSEYDALLAITQPLRGTDYSYAPGVAEQLVENLLMVPIETADGVTRVRGDSVDPVQLQVVCQTLWDNCQESWRKSSGEKRVVSRRYLEDFGDVDEALSGFYEKAIKHVAGVTGLKEGVLRRWFEQNLITSAGTRGTVFRGATETGNISNDAVDELVEQHIIRAERRGGSRWYELTHDRFIPPIKISNENWLRKHSGGEQTPKRLEANAQIWARGGRQKKELIHDDGELLEAERWMESNAAAEVGYSDTLLALVQASRASKNEEKIRSSRRLKLLVTALMLLTPLLIVALIATFISRRSAQAREAEATLARQKAYELAKTAEQQRNEAEKQKILADLQTKQLEIANIMIQGKQGLAEQEAMRALISERIARQNRAKAEDLNKVIDGLSTEVDEINNQYNYVLERITEPTSQCSELSSLKKKYEATTNNYKALGEQTTGKVLLDQAAKQISQIDRQIRDLRCAP